VEEIAVTYKGDLFAGRGVFVTGGSSGIGLGVARAFRALGAAVTATGVTQNECDLASKDAANSGIKFAPLDVRDGPRIEQLLRDLPNLHVVVNAAGVIRRDLEHDPEQFAEVVAINLNGTMRVCAAAKSRLAASKGCVINVASMLTFFGSPRAPGYAASKGGIGQLTKSLAAAWAKDSIRVNAVAPGWIATPLTEALRQDQEKSRPILMRTPMDRWGTPEEVAGAVVFLASPAAKFITGAILPIDGGYSAV
jgi:NAD(P)-dependent dehydrogenase (short-subunit alcohol dehydrogenase family)